MNFLQDIDFKKTGITIGVLVLIFGIGMGIHYFITQNDKPGVVITEDIDIDGIQGVEEIIGKGDVKVTLTPAKSELYEAPAFTIGATAQTAYGTDILPILFEVQEPSSSELDIPLLIEEIKAQTTIASGIFERPEYPEVSAVFDTDILEISSGNLNEFFLRGQNLSSYPDPQSSLLRYMREEQTGKLKTFGHLESNDSHGVYLINDQGYDGYAGIEAYIWGKTNIVKITGTLNTSDDTFPQWLQSIMVK